MGSTPVEMAIVSHLDGCAMETRIVVITAMNKAVVMCYK